MWNDYDPQVGFDLHTSDGSYHGYYLTYSPPLNPNTAPSIMDLMKNEWFPFVTKNIKSKHGWDTFYYGNWVAAADPASAEAGGRRRLRAERAAVLRAGAAAAVAGRRCGAAAACGRGWRTAGGAAAAGRRLSGAAARLAAGRGRWRARLRDANAGGAHTAVAGPAAANDPMRSWNTFEHVPRFHNNYVGCAIASRC
jgi:hypothetical protein